jgi:hypothetical protein
VKANKQFWGSLVLVSILFAGTNAFGWQENHHRHITGDAIDYMNQSDDPLLVQMSMWMWSTTGYNTLLRGDTNWYTDPRCRGSYSAACALMDQAANADHLADVFVCVDTVMLRIFCWSMIPILSQLTCQVLGEVDSISPGDGCHSSFKDYNMTSMNHYIGAFYEDDRVFPRNLATDPRFTRECEGRSEYHENLGYFTKNLGGDCNDQTEGDCKNEEEAISQWVSLNDDEVQSVATLSGTDVYNDITCHHHQELSGSISGTRYHPLDSLAEYWVQRFRESDDVLDLGLALHMAQDAMNPHHSYIYQGRGHSMYESWTGTKADESLQCRNGDLTPELCNEWLTAQFFSASSVGDFITSIEKGGFVKGDLPEFLVADTAEHYTHVPYPSDPLDPLDYAFARAMVWQDRNATELARPENRDWWTVSAMQNNLATALTVELMKRELKRYADKWREHGYCRELYDFDRATWYQILPGLKPGTDLPALTEQARNYIRLVSDLAETRHPYTNDSCPDGFGQGQNTVEFGFPAPYGGIVIVAPESVKLWFEPQMDWHTEEGDKVKVFAVVLDSSNHRVDVEIASYNYAEDLRGVNPLVISGPFQQGNWIGIKVVLTQGELGYRCTPIAKYGFKIDRIEGRFRMQPGPGSELGWKMSQDLLGWVQGIMEGRIRPDFGVLVDCAPGSECDREVAGELADAFGSEGPLFDGRVFDIVNEALARHSADPARSPPLVAYAVAAMVQSASTGTDVVNTGLAESAAEWSLLRQGMTSSRAGVLQAEQEVTATIDFTRPGVGSRPEVVRRDGTVIPGVQAPDMRGYPGFRAPTAQELSDLERYSAYLEAKEADVKRYQSRRRTEVALAVNSGLRTILDTDSGENPAATERIQALRDVLDMREELVSYGLDGDGDGVPDVSDACPAVCAKGMDANGDGCLDEACGLRAEIEGSAGFWLARLLLALQADTACALSQHGKTRASAGVLLAIEVMIRLYARAGWLDVETSTRLAAYARNARDFLLGDTSRLACR